MNFLQRLFGPKPTTVAPSVPSETLFTESMPPADDIINTAFAPEPETLETSPKGFVYTRPVAIREFTDRDYAAMGEQEALLNPNAELRDQRLDALGKKFRFVLMHVQENMEAQVQQLMQHMVMMGEVSPVVARMQQNRLQQLQDMLKKLEHQAELSVDGEGWIAPVLADYRDGFTRGTLRFLRENDILKGLNVLT